MSNQSHQNGKGSKPRPVNKKQYNSNYDSINWGTKKSVDNSKKSSKIK